MSEKRFRMADGTFPQVVAFESNKGLTYFDVLDKLNELDEKLVDEHCLNETLRVELQRLEAENEKLKQENGELLILNASKEDYIRRKMEL